MIPEREETTSDESETKELPPEDLEALSEQATEAAADAKAEAEAEGKAEAEAEAKAEAEAEAKAEGEEQDWKERYLRALAEQENFRKNTERERARERKYAGETLMRDLLPVLDALQLACSAEGDVDAIRKGIELAHQSLMRVLQDNGLQAIEAEDAAFDPSLHEAMATIAHTEHEPGAVVMEVSRGYTLHGRLLRPSRVHVAVAAPKPADEQAEEKEESE